MPDTPLSTIGSITLDKIVQAYLADSEFQKAREDLVKRREESIPALQAVALRFIRGETDLQTFRVQMQQTLNAGESWGATSFGFMMELHNLGKYHSLTSSAPETTLRTVLTGLNAKNLGERIEQFYNFLLAERDRLRAEGKSSGMIVAARKSAFMISLFAFWLDPAGQPIVYFDSLRKGLFMLIKASILPAIPGIQLGANKVEVRTAADHQACVELFNYLASQAPQIKLGAYWAENFCYWVTLHFQSLNDPSATLVKESDDTDLLAKSAAQTPKVREAIPVYTLIPPVSQPGANGSAHDGAVLIPHEPLRPVPEPVLKERIREVQRFILVDESMVRRIYRGLLDGHLILTGPPGTGKTELARIIPEILWRNEVPSDGETDTMAAYTTRLCLCRILPGAGV